MCDYSEKAALCGLSWISRVGIYTVHRLSWQAYTSPTQKQCPAPWAAPHGLRSFRSWPECEREFLVSASFFEPHDRWFAGRRMDNSRHVEDYMLPIGPPFEWNSNMWAAQQPVLNGRHSEAICYTLLPSLCLSVGGATAQRDISCSQANPFSFNGSSLSLAVMRHHQNQASLMAWPRWLQILSHRLTGQSWW